MRSINFFEITQQFPIDLQYSGLYRFSLFLKFFKEKFATVGHLYRRPSPPKIQGCQTDQQIQKLVQRSAVGQLFKIRDRKSTSRICFHFVPVSCTFFHLLCSQVCFFQLEVVYNHDYKLRFNYRRFLSNCSLLSADLSVNIKISIRKEAISPIGCRLQYILRHTTEQPI